MYIVSCTVKATLVTCFWESREAIPKPYTSDVEVSNYGAYLSTKTLT